MSSQHLSDENLKRPFRLQVAEGQGLPKELWSLRELLWAPMGQTPSGHNGDVHLSVEEVDHLLEKGTPAIQIDLLEKLEERFPPDLRQPVADRTARKALEQAREEQRLWTPELDMAARRYLPPEGEMLKGLEREGEIQQELQRQLVALGHWIQEQKSFDQIEELMGFRSRALYQCVLKHWESWTPEATEAFLQYATGRLAEQKAEDEMLVQFLDQLELNEEIIETFLAYLGEHLPVRTRKPAAWVLQISEHPRADQAWADTIIQFRRKQARLFSARTTEKLLESSLFQEDTDRQQQLLACEPWHRLVAIFEGLIQQRFQMNRYHLVKHIVERYPGAFAQHLDEAVSRTVLWSLEEIQLFLQSGAADLRSFGLRCLRQIRDPAKRDSTSRAASPHSRDR